MSLRCFIYPSVCRHLLRQLAERAPLRRAAAYSMLLQSLFRTSSPCKGKCPDSSGRRGMVQLQNLLSVFHYFKFSRVVCIRHVADRILIKGSSEDELPDFPIEWFGSGEKWHFWCIVIILVVVEKKNTYFSRGP